SIEEAKRQVQIQDRILRGFPEVASVFGKAGRAESATDPAPLTMVETTVRLKPVEDWRMLPRPRWYSSRAPDLLARALRPIWPDRRRITPGELTALMNDAVQLPGWTNAFTMPIKARVDMLSTGIRTPVGVKVMGTDLAEIEKVGVRLEALLKPMGGTRSVLYERNPGAVHIDIVPLRDALGRYRLTVGGRRAVQWQRVDPVALQGLTGEGVTTAAKRGFVSLGQVADVRIVGGPPMVRDEGGLLVGYVFIDVDPSRRDLGGYVGEAKQ